MQDLETVKAWGVALMQRVKELEDARSVSPPRRRSGEVGRCIETQTWETFDSGADSGDDRKRQELTHANQSLAEQNALLRVQLEKYKSGDMDTTIHKLQEQVVSQKLGVREAEGRVRVLEAENYELRRRRSENGDGGGLSRDVRGETLRDLGEKVRELETVNSLTLRENGTLQTRNEELMHQREASKEAMDQASLEIQQLKRDAVQHDGEMKSMKAQWDKERLRWIEERKHSIESLDAHAAAVGVTDGVTVSIEAMEQLRIELKRVQRESAVREAEFEEREAEYVNKIRALGETVKVVEAERSESVSFASKAESRENESRTRVEELEKSVKEMQVEREALEANHQIRISDLETKLRKLESKPAPSDTNDSKYQTRIAELESTLHKLRLETTAEIQTLLARAPTSQLDTTLSTTPASAPTPAPATDPTTTTNLTALESENHQLKSAITSLTHDLESSNQAIFTLTQKLKTATSTPSHDALLEQHVYKIESLQHALEIQKDRYHASQARSQSILDALNRTEGELARLRLSQADVGKTLLLKGSDADMEDLARTLQKRNGELASEVMGLRETVKGLEGERDRLKGRVVEREAVVAGAVEMKRELEDLRVKGVRERENWVGKERAMYAATQTLQREYRALGEMVMQVKQAIWRNGRERKGWNRGGGGERAEDVDLLGWCQWMTEANSRLEEELVETNQVLDMQHEKMESVIAMSEAEGPSTTARSVLSSPVSRILRRLGGGGFAGGSSKLADEMGVDSASTSSTSSLNALLEWSNNVADTNASGYHSHNLPPATPTHPDTDDDIILPLPLTVTSKSSTEKTQIALKKLMSRNVALQQKLNAIEAQLEYQIVANKDMKQMFLGHAIEGGSSEASLEQFNDALVEIGGLRSEVEHWRAKYDEMETVVEGLVMERLSKKDEEEAAAAVALGFVSEALPEVTSNQE
ncbi:hypothetical protein HDU98_004593 [Podochytrium sp. JEL0797]|nr:hypothetical protein HDU98_004593 [Podochytrium sp. JEL0797]